MVTGLFALNIIIPNSILIVTSKSVNSKIKRWHHITTNPFIDTSVTRGNMIFPCTATKGIELHS
jgi:hypothetical protein